MKKALLLLLLVLFSASVSALVTNSQLKVLAVTSDGQGLGADLFLEIEEGDGSIWVSAEPLVGTTTQSAARTAREVAKKFSLDVDSYDYKFSIDSVASLVEGPSAGAAMALLIISSLQDRQIPSNISLTGTIDSSGNVGPVGGVYEKTLEAANLGIGLFMIPRGESIQTVRINGTVKSINLLEYGPMELGMTIVEVGNIDDVLQYAFSDIEAIDVSQIIAEGAIPEFVPEPIEIEGHLIVMKDLVTNYLAETNVLIEEAKHSVSTAIIDDPALVNTLLDTITSSEQTMRQAEILNEQNYLYSSANFAFLARVNAQIVKTISTNPGVLNLNSTVLDVKIQQLNTELADLEDRLDSSIPLDYLEWYISAQQRLSYAKINLEKLSSTQVIVINGNNISDSFERISDYEFAVAWVDIARDFYEISRNSTKRVRPNNNFARAMDELLLNGEQVVSELPPEIADDILRRINASKFEKAKGWNMASVFDAASAFALASSEKLTVEKELTELSTVLESKINDLEGKLTNSPYKFSWSVLYLDHAKYFLESSKYYTESNQTARAVNSLRSGISLIMLADQLFLAAEPMYSFYSNTPNSELLSEKNFYRDEPKLLPDIPESALLLALLGVVAMFLIGAAYFFIHLSGGRQLELPSSEIQTLKDFQKKADHALFEGKISEEKHSELIQTYSLKLELIEKNHQAKVEKILEIDKDRSELLAVEKRLKDLKRHFKQGVLSETEFRNAQNRLTVVLKQSKQILNEIEKPVIKKKKIVSFKRKIKPATKPTTGKRKFSNNKK